MQDIARCVVIMVYDQPASQASVGVVHNVS